MLLVLETDYATESSFKTISLPVKAAPVRSTTHNNLKMKFPILHSNPWVLL